MAHDFMTTGLPLGHSLRLQSTAGPSTCEMPQSSILSRLKAFLPEMQQANAQLPTGTADPTVSIDPLIDAAGQDESGSEDDGTPQMGKTTDYTSGASSGATASAGHVEMDVALGLWQSAEQQAAAVDAIEERPGGASAAAASHPVLSEAAHSLLRAGVCEAGAPPPAAPRSMLVQELAAADAEPTEVEERGAEVPKKKLQKSSTKKKKKKKAKKKK
eukprot:g6164.t1